jgi:hypothetical protein
MIWLEARSTGGWQYIFMEYALLSPRLMGHELDTALLLPAVGSTTPISNLSAWQYRSHSTSDCVHESIPLHFFRKFDDFPAQLSLVGALVLLDYKQVATRQLLLSQTCPDVKFNCA